MAQKAKWDARLILASLLFSLLAFNLVFFLQELMLVLPKAFVPGVHVWLYHNNHHWTGDAPILPLLQGTGGLTDLVAGLVFATLLNGAAKRSLATRLFLFWMAFQGFYQGLSQVMIGAFLPQNDMGMAFHYLGLAGRAEYAVFALGLILSAAAGFWLARKAICLIATNGETESGRARMGFVLRIVMIPALVAGPLLIPFRLPRNSIELVIFPTVLMVFGALWVVAGASFSPPIASQDTRPMPSLLLPVVALLAVLVLFQVVLRPGIAFS